MRVAETLKYFVYRSTGSSPSPEEERLLKHLFDPDYQERNLMTTPVLNVSDTMNVSVTMKIRKIIALVRKDHAVHHVVHDMFVDDFSFICK